MRYLVIIFSAILLVLFFVNMVYANPMYYTSSPYGDIFLGKNANASLFLLYLLIPTVLLEYMFLRDFLKYESGKIRLFITVAIFNVCSFFLMHVFLAVANFESAFSFVCEIVPLALEPCALLYTYKWFRRAQHPVDSLLVKKVVIGTSIANVITFLLGLGITLLYKYRLALEYAEWDKIGQ